MGQEGFDYLPGPPSNLWDSRSEEGSWLPTVCRGGDLEGTGEGPRVSGLGRTSLLLLWAEPDSPSA